MLEKFSDFEGNGFIAKEGEFVFTVVNAELKQSSKGGDMVVLEVKSDEGSSTVYHSLNPKARWSYNNLIKACLGMKTKEQIAAFECDYSTIHQQLIGKQFVGVVKCEPYTKTVKVPTDDGEFIDKEEIKDSYKIKEYKFVD